MEKKDLASVADPATSILIVDDNQQFSLILRRMLGAFGYKNITTVENTEEAYTLISTQPDGFQLLFVDYNFPSGKTGGELLKKLSKEKLLEGKFAFLITANPTVENTTEAVKAGAMGVVAKPFDRNQISDALKKAERAVITNNTEGF